MGGFWTRTNNPEIDIIGGDRGPIAKAIVYAGTIKWRDVAVLGQPDINRLAADLAKVAGAGPSTPLIGVSRTGSTTTGAALTIGPEDLLAAWGGDLVARPP